MLTLISPEAVPEAGEIITAIVDAFRASEWSLLVSLVIMALVYLATRMPVVKDWIKGDAKIWVAAVAGVLSAFATAVYADASAGAPVDWLGAVVKGLSVGFAAGGLWTAIGKRIAGKPLDSDTEDGSDVEKAS